MTVPRDVRALAAAFAYFSVVPIRAKTGPDARAVAWLPFVGAALGGLAGTLALGIGTVAPHAIAVAVAFGATLALSGAIHLDGFLDVCDALFAPVPLERRYAILKDPHHGTFALAGLAIVAPLWLAALWSLPASAYPPTLAFAAACARWCAVVHALGAPSPRADASTAALTVRAPWPVVVAGGLLVCALAIPLGWRGFAGAGSALLAGAAAMQWARWRLGGRLVGDAYGFAIVIAEVVVLATLAPGRSR